MKFDLAQMVRRKSNPRRSSIPLREIVPPATLGGDLYRAAYKPVVDLWSAAEPRLIAEYERTLAAMTMDSPADIQREIDAVAGEVQRLLLILTPRLRDWAVRVEGWHRRKWRSAVLSATGVDLDTLIGPADVAETIETVIQRNVALIKDVSAQAQGRISDAVFRGLTERKPAREVAKEVREAVDMGRRRSINIASDQLTKLSSSLDGERMRQAGIDSWKWRHSGKAHPRTEHQAREGKVYTFTKPPAEMPGQLPFCGCRKQAVIDLA